MAKNGWTRERRIRQSEAIQRWKPWEKATGPTSEAGKAKVAKNAYKGGLRVKHRAHMALMRELRDILKGANKMSRELSKALRF